jgi:membrane protease YdiL (CAAX protease family)
LTEEKLTHVGAGRRAATFVACRDARLAPHSLRVHCSGDAAPLVGRAGLGVFAPAREAARVTGLVPVITQLLGAVGAPFDQTYLVLEFLANIALFVPLGRCWPSCSPACRPTRPFVPPLWLDGWWLFGAILAPVLISPVVEEPFFRGLLQRSIPTRLPFAIFASATVFALVHLLGGYSLFSAATTFIVGITFGIVAGRSVRLGSAIVAHVAFNTQLRLTRPKSGWGRLSLYGILRELQRVLAVYLGYCPHCRQRAPT